jgi:hypothetical protein
VEITLRIPARYQAVTFRNTKYEKFSFGSRRHIQTLPEGFRGKILFLLGNQANPNIHKIKAGEFEASLGYNRPCLKTNKNVENIRVPV